MYLIRRAWADVLWQNLKLVQGCLQATLRTSSMSHQDESSQMQRTLGHLDSGWRCCRRNYIGSARKI